MPSRPTQPLIRPGTQFDWIAGSCGVDTDHAIARETSWALLNRVRQGTDRGVVERVVQLAADGFDDIAELWSTASAHSLAGQLWRLYLLQHVAKAHPASVAELFRVGSEATATIHSAVAGAAEPISPESITALCDTILRGAFSGDLGVALERAASYCSIMSLGAAAIADNQELVDDANTGELTTCALRYATLADELRDGAKHLRAGTLD